MFLPPLPIPDTAITLAIFPVDGYTGPANQVATARHQECEDGSAVVRPISVVYFPLRYGSTRAGPGEYVN